MTRVTQLIHDAGKYLLISVYPLPTHPTHNFTHNNGGNLETLPGWPKKLQHNRPAQSAGQKIKWISSKQKPSSFLKIHQQTDKRNVVQKNSFRGFLNEITIPLIGSYPRSYNKRIYQCYGGNATLSQSFINCNDIHFAPMNKQPSDDG